MKCGEYRAVYPGCCLGVTWVLVIVGDVIFFVLVSCVCWENTGEEWWLLVLWWSLVWCRTWGSVYYWLVVTWDCWSGYSLVMCGISTIDLETTLYDAKLYVTQNWWYRVQKWLLVMCWCTPKPWQMCVDGEVCLKKNMSLTKLWTVTSVELVGFVQALHPLSGDMALCNNAMNCMVCVWCLTELYFC